MVVPEWCRDREILKSRLRADLKVYADAIEVLQYYAMGALAALEDSRADFKKARRLAEHARLAYQSSRQKLSQHVASHYCE
jgi:hypothetical protein